MKKKQTQIPDGWEEIQFNKLGQIYNGLSGKKKEDFLNEGSPYIPYVNVFNHSVIKTEEVDYVLIKKGEKQNTLKYGDLLFTTSSETIEEVGMTSIFLGESNTYYLNSFCFGFRLYDFNQLTPEFAQYLFRTENVRYKISLLGQGSTRYNLSKTRLLSELKLVTPKSTTEQKKIAEILSKVYASIEQTQSLIAKNQRIRIGLMQDLLTKGIDENGNIRSAETHEFSESNGFKYPNEWQVKTVGKCLLNIEQGWSPNCDSEPSSMEEWGVLKTTAVTWKGYDENENKRLPKKLIPKTQYEVKDGDVLITRAGPNSRVGVVSFIERTRSKLIFSDKLYRVIPKDYLLNKYLAMALSSQFTQRHLSTFKTGMAESQTNISQEIVKGLNILLPKKQEQERIIQVLNKSEKYINDCFVELEKFQSIKTGLMQDLLSGKKRVTNQIKENAL